MGFSHALHLSHSPPLPVFQGCPSDSYFSVFDSDRQDETYFFGHAFRNLIWNCAGVRPHISVESVCTILQYLVPCWSYPFRTSCGVWGYHRSSSRPFLFWRAADWGRAQLVAEIEAFLESKGHRKNWCTSGIARNRGCIAAGISRQSLNCILAKSRKRIVKIQLNSGKIRTYWQKLVEKSCSR